MFASQQVIYLLHIFRPIRHIGQFPPPSLLELIYSNQAICGHWMAYRISTVPRMPIAAAY